MCMTKILKGKISRALNNTSVGVLYEKKVIIILLIFITGARIYILFYAVYKIKLDNDDFWRFLLAL